MKPCEACGAPTSPADLSFTKDGREVCKRCFSHASVIDAQAQANLSHGAGAQILNPIGKAAMRSPRLFARLMIAGAIALPLFVIISVTLAFTFGEWLRDCMGSR
jgi:hypothetical protein